MQSAVLILMAVVAVSALAAPGLVIGTLMLIAFVWVGWRLVRSSLMSRRVRR